MELDLNEVDRSLQEIPVNRNRDRTTSTESTLEDDVAISEAINEIEGELKKEQKGGFSASAVIMTAVLVGGIVTSQILPFLLK